jgi:hypothetical protein
VPTAEAGEVEILLWTPAEWAPCKGTWVDGLVAHVDVAALNHALAGYSKPLVAALGLPPAGALRKIPAPARACAHAPGCTLAPAGGCAPAHKDLPLCYTPWGLGPEAAGLAYQVVLAWREGVYVVVREGDPDDG